MFAERARPSWIAHDDPYVGYLFTSAVHQCDNYRTSVLLARSVSTRCTRGDDRAGSPSVQTAGPAAQSGRDRRVERARAGVIEICARLGCGHFQIGRCYPYRASRDPASWALVETLKQTLDPGRVLNPGGLGLDPPI